MVAGIAVVSGNVGTAVVVDLAMAVVGCGLAPIDGVVGTGTVGVVTLGLSLACAGELVCVAVAVTS